MRAAIACAVAICVLAAAGSASAAVVIGQSPPLAGGAASCGNLNSSLVQQTVESGPSYTVPAGGGVITSWRTSVTDVDAPVALRVFTGDPAGTAFTPVAESAVETAVQGTTPTFATRISVSGGELIGLRVADPVSAPNGCIYVGAAGGDSAGLADETDVRPVGQAETHMSFAGWRVNVAATLEPDCDDDGFGDETQDTNTTSCSPPPPPPPPADTEPPETTITKGAPDELTKSKFRFRFASSEPGSTFECKVDRKRFRPCTSPRKVKGLDDGKHRFKVVATDAAGNRDPTAAKDRFKVVE